MKKQMILVAFIGLLVSSVGLQARNKPQAIFSNEYGDDVTGIITWKSNTFPYAINQEGVIIKAGTKEAMFKAPYSMYDLDSIEVVPTKNIDGLNRWDYMAYGMDALGTGTAIGGILAGSSGMISSNATGALVGAGFVMIGASVVSAVISLMQKAANKHKIENVHGHNYFVLEKGKKQIKVFGKNQSQIIIHSYKSKAEYEKETKKAENKLEQEVQKEKKQEKKDIKHPEVQKEIKQKNQVEKPMIDYSKEAQNNIEEALNQQVAVAA